MKIFKDGYNKIKEVDIDDISLIEEKIGRRVKKLSRNENVHGPSKKIKEIEFAMDHITYYPELENYEFDEQVARLCGVDSHNVFTGSGTDEFIYYIAKATTKEGDVVSLFENTFRSYETAFTKQGALINVLPFKNGKHEIEVNNLVASKVVVIVSPNMPTGELYTPQEIMKIHKGLSPETLLLIDHAYIEYTDKDDTFYKDVINNKNIIVLRTFSKFYGLAGLRLGWIISHHETIKTIKSNMRRLSVSKPSYDIARVAISDLTYYNNIKLENNKNKKMLLEMLDAFKVKRYEANGNFVLIDSPHSDKIYASLLNDHGILVRKYRDSNFIRLTIGTEEDTMIMIKVITSILKND